jgi:hypothetical protein
VWALLAYVVAALFVLLLVYLGLRPGGRGPIFAWGRGRDLLQLVALALLGTGMIWSFLHRPVFRPRRRIPFFLLSLVVGGGSYPFPYPSSHEGHPSSVRFRLPVEGDWTVFWGGETKEENLLVAYSAERRFGLDLVVAVDGVTHPDGAQRPGDYSCFGATVLAPADGTVVRAVGDVIDGMPGTIDRSVPQLGNHVVIRVAEGEFVFLAHLEQGSLLVKEGDAVKSGAPIGRVGNSGWSVLTPEPHLAVHLQDSPEPRGGEPIPWNFHGYVANGLRVEKGVPRGGIGAGGSLRGQRIATFAP